MKHVIGLLVIVSSSYGASFAFDGGLAYAALNGGRYETDYNSVNRIIHEDSQAWGPFIGAGVNFSDQFGLRLGYQYFPGLEADVEYLFNLPIPGQIGSPPPLFKAHLKSDVHIFTLSPQLRLKFSPSAGVIVSPDLNWVLDSTSSSDNLSTFGRTNALTLGGSFILHYALNPHWTTRLGIHYLDAKPSRDRKGTVMSLGFEFH